MPEMKDDSAVGLVRGFYGDCLRSRRMQVPRPERAGGLEG